MAETSAFNASRKYFLLVITLEYTGVINTYYNIGRT